MTEPAEDETAEQAHARYMSAMSAMQSGVAVKFGLDPTDASPKFLRAGVNSALIQQGALVRLLVSKGVITEEEWIKTLADTTDEEVAIYEKVIFDLTGARVTLQ